MATDLRGMGRLCGRCRSGLGASVEGDGARAVRGRVSGVGLGDGRSGSRLPDNRAGGNNF